MKFPVSLDEIPKRQEILLFIMIIVTGIVALARTLYVIEVSEIDRLKVQIKTLRQEETAIHKFQQAVLMKKTVESKTTPPASNMRLQIVTGERLPSVGDLTSLVGLVTGESFLGGLVLKSIRYDPAEVQEGYRKASLEAEVEGRFQDILEYLGELDRLVVLLEVNDIELVPEKEGSDIIRLRWKANYYEMGH